MTWQAGTAYTASLSPDMFTIGSGRACPTSSTRSSTPPSGPSRCRSSRRRCPTGSPRPDGWSSRSSPSAPGAQPHLHHDPRRSSPAGRPSPRRPSRSRSPERIRPGTQGPHPARDVRWWTPVALMASSAMPSAAWASMSCVRAQSTRTKVRVLPLGRPGSHAAEAEADEDRLVLRGRRRTGQATPSRTVRASARMSAAVAPPRLVTARVCLVDRVAGPGMPKPFPEPGPFDEPRRARLHQP